ncbi:MAG TPA: ABC transporter [Anaerolineaceae bacterium]|nr:ABC transporter [Anaerolineaceae bacterium]HBA90527.1 ABC transporter [Anaerolineaceae bacterium]
MTSALPQPSLQVRNLSVTYPNDNGGLQALTDLTFDVHPREFICILGPSGSGKTTLLRVLAGLLPPSSGEVCFLTEQAPLIGYVFQQANLMPWRSAMENIMLPLEMQGVPLENARRRAAELIELTGLKGFEDSWPRDLSGGMAQRVAIARALIQDPDLLLLDEPFGSLDELTRDRMGEELLDLWQNRRSTVLMVTHSVSEALLLSDRVLVLTPRPGQLALDYPVTLERPRCEEMRYTAQFGEMAKELRAAIIE